MTLFRPIYNSPTPKCIIWYPCYVTPSPEWRDILTGIEINLQKRAKIIKYTGASLNGMVWVRITTNRWFRTFFNFLNTWQGWPSDWAYLWSNQPFEDFSRLHLKYTKEKKLVVNISIDFFHFELSSSFHLNQWFSSFLDKRTLKCHLLSNPKHVT